MKKYSIYALVFCILLGGIFSLAIWSKRIDFSLGLRKSTDYEHTSVGDPNEIKDLEYQLTISDYNRYWTINGRGEKMNTTYHKGDYYSLKNHLKKKAIDSDKYYNFTIEPVMNEKYIDSSKVEKASKMGYTFSEDFDPDVTEVKKVDYEFKIKDIDGNEILSNSFRVDVKNPRESLRIMYGNHNSIDELFRVSDGENRIYMKSYSQNSNSTEDLMTKTYSYFYIGTGAFSFNTKDIKFSKPIGGIYRIDQQKAVKQIVSVDLDENILYTMVIYNDQIYAVMRKKENLYLQKYDKDGTLLKEQKLDIEADLAKATINFSNGNLLVSTVTTNDTLNEKTRILNTDTLNMREKYNYPLKNFEALYKYRDGKLTVVSGDSSNVYVRVFSKDKTLYDSEFFGDYQDDEKIVISDGSSHSGNPNFNPLYRLLYIDKRGIYVDWIK